MSISRVFFWSHKRFKGFKKLLGSSVDFQWHFREPTRVLEEFQESGAFQGHFEESKAIS